VTQAAANELRAYFPQLKVCFSELFISFSPCGHHESRMTLAQRFPTQKCPKAKVFMPQ
jgi:hypothetical protein